jgi:hypothetical protein
MVLATAATMQAAPSCAIGELAAQISNVISVGHQGMREGCRLRMKLHASGLTKDVAWSQDSARPATPVYERTQIPDAMYGKEYACNVKGIATWLPTALKQRTLVS